MPYIKQDRRFALGCGADDPQNMGELNYCLTRWCLSVMQQSPNYQEVNEVIGALECCKQELYRRVAVPIEEIACATRGDVYE